MKTLTMMALLATTMMLVGCATQNNYVPDAARTQAVQAVSIPHPVENEKAGEQHVTVFTAILNAGTWGAESVNGSGVWPVLAEQFGSKPFVGDAFVTDLNWWGDLTLQVIVVGRKENLINAKIVHLDRDGGKIHDLSGKEFDYDPKKFDEDPEYAHQAFQNGMTLKEAEAFWQMYSEKRGIELDKTSFREIKVGSPEWEALKSQLAEKLGHNYTMPDGEVRQGYLSQEEFKKQSASKNAATPEQRFARNLNVNFGAIDFGIASSILNGLIDANNGPIEGFYARATCLRGDLKPNFILMQQMFQALLQQRDRVIYSLQQKLAQEASRR